MLVRPPRFDLQLLSFLSQSHMVYYLLGHIMALTLLESDRTSTRSITPQRIWILRLVVRYSTVCKSTTRATPWCSVNERGKDDSAAHARHISPCNAVAALKRDVTG